MTAEKLLRLSSNSGLKEEAVQGESRNINGYQGTFRNVNFIDNRVAEKQARQWRSNGGVPKITPHRGATLPTPARPVLAVWSMKHQRERS